MASRPPPEGRTRRRRGRAWRTRAGSVTRCRDQRRARLPACGTASRRLAVGPVRAAAFRPASRDQRDASGSHVHRRGPCRSDAGRRRGRRISTVLRRATAVLSFEPSNTSRIAAKCGPAPPEVMIHDGSAGPRAVDGAFQAGKRGGERGQALPIPPGRGRWNRRMRARRRPSPAKARPRSGSSNHSPVGAAGTGRGHIVVRMKTAASLPAASPASAPRSILPACRDLQTPGTRWIVRRHPCSVLRAVILLPLRRTLASTSRGQVRGDVEDGYQPASGEARRPEVSRGRNAP